MSEDYISWTSFCQAMNSIAYWLIQNQKKYKKRDHYQILTLKGNCKDIEKKAKSWVQLSWLQCILWRPLKTTSHWISFQIMSP